MALTQADKQELLNAIRAESQSVDELEQVNSLDGIVSLPAMKGTKIVTAPISLLGKPATDAAAIAKSAASTANAAAAKADTASSNADRAAQDADRATQEAEDAAGTASSAAADALQIVARYENTAVAARNGATARFGSIVESATIGAMSILVKGAYSIVYVRSAKSFACYTGGTYYNNWAGDNVPLADLYMNDTRSAIRKDKAFICGSSVYVWSEEEQDLVEISGSGAGGNSINVTEEYPLATGYHSLASAIAAIDAKRRALGRVIEYQVGQGKWESKRFIGSSLDSWEQPASWEDYGGSGTVKTITVNGARKQPDSNGDISLTIDEVEVDSSLDPNSTNSVENRVLAAKIGELETGTLFDSEVIENDDNTVTVKLNGKSGAITEFTLPAGKGGGGEEASTTKIVLGASVDNRTIKEGGSVLLTYTYDHQYSGGDEKGESTGQKANITIEVKRGSTVVYTATLKDVSKGTYTVDLTKDLLVGSNDIYVRATAVDPNTGKQQNRQVYTSVKSVTLSLSSSYNLATSIQEGGYSSLDTVDIPFAVSGSGTKTVTLYVDGNETDSKVITRSGTVNSNFLIPMSGKSVGRHTIQLVAEMDAGDGLVLRSESIHIDILKSGSSSPFIGMKVVDPEGNIRPGALSQRPKIKCGQYEKVQFDYIVYDPTTTPASVDIYMDDALSGRRSVPRSAQVFESRFTAKGTHHLTFRSGATAYGIDLEVADSGIDLNEATYGLVAKFDAAGRSNSESNPATWESNGIATAFEGFDWNSSGWTGESLKLTNGAKATIGFQPFKSDVKSTGLTIEITMRVSNVMSRNASVISCIDNGKGLLITAENAGFRTGQVISYTNEDDEEVQREVKLGTNYVTDKWIKVALTVCTRAENRLMHLYVDGNRTGADIYDSSFNFQQANPQSIVIDSADADVEIRKVRIYSRAISDDEELENDIVDAETSDEMMRRYDENDVLGPNGIDIDKIRAKGKGVLRIVRKNKLDDVYAENNKKTDFVADVYFYSPFGREYDFVLRDCFIRIQGTSSTKYPSKNIRIYCNKGGETLVFTVNGVENPYGKNRYCMRPGAIPMNLFCCKSDYSDSSMSLNTGGAKLFNDCMKELMLLTPPQRYQYEHGGNTLAAVNVRTAIDGIPIDIFCAETDDGESEYYGQYNFNNEKSKSGPLFGMEGVEGFTPALPRSFEMLNNTQPGCLFKSTSDADLAANFDAGLEFNYPEDVKYATADEATRTALKRLFGWIRSCVPAGADSNDISTFRSAKFKAEIDQYFDKDFILTYYAFTDYFLSVDQRAKNMILRTWDGLKWYLTYYDGDTQMGKRNDCFLVYRYDTDRDTYDAEASKYAFEGRDSWLWNLVLANLWDDLCRCVANLRAVMTNERVLAMFNDEQSGHWSDRAFNKSGEIKYIRPAIQEMYGKVWPFIYALQGSNRAHREYFIKNRFALLDAKYGTSNFTSDNADFYLSRTSGDDPDIVKIAANEVYAFGYGTNNLPNIANSGIIAEGETASLEISGAYTVNDPLRLYGASRIRILDMSGASDHLKNGFDLGKCSVLRELNMQSSGTGSTGWWLNIGGCRSLQRVNLRNQSQAKTGTSTSTELDFSGQTKLEYLDARGTSVQSVTFAKGAPLRNAYLPKTITTLRLEYLASLTQSNLVLESWGNVRTLIFDSCPGLSWEAMLNRCPNMERLRVTGIDREDDGSWLAKFKNIGGIDAEGNATDTCALVGTVRLTSYMADDEYAELKKHFPELNILQPEYSVIEFDDTVSDPANISNLDNGTGYKFGNKFVPSGHVLAISRKRHRVLAKVTKKATTRNVRIANTDTIVNNPDGEMTYFPLHDGNSNFYADADDARKCTGAKLDGTEGDIMMLEPHHFSKGVNDYLNGKHYSCWASGSTMPSRPAATVLTFGDIEDAENIIKGRKILGGKDTLANSYTNDAAYSVCKVDVSGFRRVRFPSVPGTNLVGSVFTDDAGKVLESVIVSTIGCKFEAGMYLVKDVPDGASQLHFSILNTAEFDKVVLSNSTKIEDMEPDWYESEEFLCAVVGSSTVGTSLRACITGGSTTAGMTWVDFHYYSVTRGMQQIDAMMHNYIANLFYALHGTRDAQEECGAGSHTNNRTTGGTMSRGMRETIGYTAAKAINPNVTNSLVDNAVHQYAWYQDGDTVVQVNNICGLGYEDIWGHKYDMMDGVDLSNDSGNAGKWRIWMPDCTVRMVKGHTNSGWWITGVAHGLYMDMVPAGTLNGSSSTYFADIYYISTAAGRVVYRGDNYAHPSGGVSCANAYHDASYSNAYVGSRLAFRGKIVRAQSVAAYKAISEVA